MLTALVGIWAKVSPKQRLGFLVGLVVIAFVVWLVGCSTGYTRTTLPNGTKVEVKQSPNSVAPAWIKLKWLGQLVNPQVSPQASPPSAQSQPSDMLEVETSTGNDQAHDYVREAQSQTLTWVGILMIVVGGLGWIAKSWIPTIPVTACLAMVFLGVGVLALPYLLASKLFLGLYVLGSVGLMAFIGWRDNHKLLLTPSPSI